MSECGVRQEQNNQINGGELNRDRQRRNQIGESAMQMRIYTIIGTVKQKYCTINGQPTKRQQKQGEKKTK